MNNMTCWKEWLGVDDNDENRNFDSVSMMITITTLAEICRPWQQWHPLAQHCRPSSHCDMLGRDLVAPPCRTAAIVQRLQNALTPFVQRAQMTCATPARGRMIPDSSDDSVSTPVLMFKPISHHITFVIIVYYIYIPFLSLRKNIQTFSWAKPNKNLNQQLGIDWNGS